MEKCESKQYQQLSFKYFVKSFLISTLLPKIYSIQTTISGGTWAECHVLQVEARCLTFDNRSVAGVRSGESVGIQTILTTLRISQLIKLKSPRQTWHGHLVLIPRPQVPGTPTQAPNPPSPQMRAPLSARG